MSARAEILAQVRLGLSSGAPAEISATATNRHPLAVPPVDPVAHFMAQSVAASATVTRVAGVGEVPDAIAVYLETAGLPLTVFVSGEAGSFLPAQGHRLRLADGPMRPDGDTVVTDCLAAVAEEGVVVLASGTTHAAEVSFLAATHVVVVRAEQIVDSLAALWPVLRSAGPMPRMVNLIRGPSRTADLGVPSRVGAHGPLRVHIVLIGGGSRRSPIPGTPADGAG